MNSWIGLIKAEWLKQRFLGLALSLGLPPLLIGLIALGMHGMIAQRPEAATWSMLVQMTFAHWGLFLATPMVLFLTTQTMAADQPKMKLLAVQGHEPQQVFIAKWFTLQMFPLIAIGLLTLGLLAVGRFLQLDDPIPWSRFGLLLMTVPLSIPIIALQMWLCVGRRNLIPLLMATLFGHFVSLIVLRSFAGRLLPWSYILELLQLRGDAAVTHPLYLLTGITLGLAFLYLGHRSFADKEWA